MHRMTIFSPRSWLVATLVVLCTLGSTASAQNELSVSTELGLPGSVREVVVSMTSDVAVQGLCFEIEYSADIVPPPDLGLEGTFFNLLDDLDPTFVSFEIDATSNIISVDVTLQNFDAEEISIPPASSLRILSIPFGTPIVTTSFGLKEVEILDGAELTDVDGVVIDLPTTSGGIFLLDPTPQGFPFEDNVYLLSANELIVAEFDPAIGEPVQIDLPIDLVDVAAAQHVSKDGTLYVTFPEPPQVRTYDPFGNEQTIIDLQGLPGPIATNFFGQPWIGVDDSVWLLGRQGEIIFGDLATGPGALGPPINVGGTVLALAAVPPTLFDPGVYGIAAEPGATDGRLFRLSFQGNLLMDLSLPVGVGNSLAVEPDGRIWVSTSDDVQLLAVDGTLIESFDLGAGSTPGKLALAAPQVCYVTDGNNVHRLTPGANPELIFEDADGASGIAVSGDGLLFVTDNTGVYLLDPRIPDLPLIDPPFLDLGLEVFICGDGTGFSQALTLCPGGVFAQNGGEDLDNDDVPNGSEIVDGGNPLNPDIQPPARSLGELVCEPQAPDLVTGLSSVNLSWLNPESYDEILVCRDGTTIVTLVSAEEEYLDEDLGEGIYEYKVQGITDTGETTNPAFCRVSVGAGQVLNSYRITDPNNTLGPPVDLSFSDNGNNGLNLVGIGDSVVSWASFSGGTIVGYDSGNSPIVYFTGPYSKPSGIAYVPWGDSSAGSVLIANGDASSVGQLTEVTLTGSPVSGRDSDSLVTADVDDIGSPISSLSITGSSSADGVIYASAPGNCEVWAFRYDTMERYDELTFEHPGADGAGYHGQAGCAAGGSSGTSSINFTSGTAGAMAEVFLTVRDPNGQLFVREYEVTDETATEVGVPIPIVEPEDTSYLGIDVSQSIPRTATVIGSSSRLYDVEAPTLPFLRGDADGNGVIFPIIDALFVLEYGFTDGPVPPCLDAADADDSGNIFAIIDALWILDYGFTDGPPPPDPGPDACGPDPTTDFDDLVGCNFYECSDD